MSLADYVLATQGDVHRYNLTGLGEFQLVILGNLVILRDVFNEHYSFLGLSGDLMDEYDDPDWPLWNSFTGTLLERYLFEVEGQDHSDFIRNYIVEYIHGKDEIIKGALISVMATLNLPANLVNNAQAYRVVEIQKIPDNVLVRNTHVYFNLYDLEEIQSMLYEYLSQ